MADAVNPTHGVTQGAQQLLQDDLAALARQLMGPPGKPQEIRKFLRSLRQIQPYNVVEQFIDELIEQGCTLPKIYIERLTALEKLLEEPLPLTRRSHIQKQLAQLLEKALTVLDEETAARRQLHYRLTRTLLELGEEQKALTVSRRLFERLDLECFSDETARLIALMQEIEQDDRLLTVARALWMKMPDNAARALLYAARLRASRAPYELEYEVLIRALGANPDHRGLVNSLARCAPRTNHLAEGEEFARRSAEISPSTGHYFIYGQVLLRRGKQDEALAAFDRIGPRLERDDLGPLAETLDDLREAINRNYYRESRTDLVELHARLSQSRQRLEKFLDENETVTLANLEAVTRKLLPLSHPFFQLGRISQVNAEFGEYFGTIDFGPYGVLAQEICEHTLTILRSALSERVLSRQLAANSLLRRMVETYAQLLLTLRKRGEAQKQFSLLTVIGISGYVLQALRESASLEAFDDSGELELVKHVEDTLSERRIDLHRLFSWQDWISRQGLRPRPLTAGFGKTAEYSVVASSGQLHHATYTQRPFNLDVVNVRGARLRDGELLIGANGAFLKPHAIHGLFPPPVPSILRNTLNAVSLRSNEETRTIDEPVILLAHNNSSRVHSYGHWLIFTLSRLNAIVEHGLLQTRKVLMPAELTPWMKETLNLIGVPDDRIIFHSRHDHIIVNDADVVSAIDNSGGDLFLRLRAKMHSTAAVSPAPMSSPFLFLARKTQLRRMMLDEDEVGRLAEKLGFVWISPETLSVAGQVHVFSRVKAIAGPGGSAFANILFCNNGTRALCIKSEENVSPFVLDLAVATGVEFRWLLGRSVPSLARYIGWDPPFKIDLGEFERQLAWAMDAVAH